MSCPGRTISWPPPAATEDPLPLRHSFRPTKTLGRVVLAEQLCLVRLSPLLALISFANVCRCGTRLSAAPSNTAPTDGVRPRLAGSATTDPIVAASASMLGHLSRAFIASERRARPPFEEAPLTCVVFPAANRLADFPWATLF
ncbi:hypothetical protein HRG_000769 [Hirsutella rhossiliensis]|uniref:Uncharacterized protein n=1 Tax=Hirsutella rhossiliensis TaxID=111463 RepID=A0A9P8NBI7_9HYPO|nr:uncharacterized protein HRG_00769 [Hirsutella rhossiliensis]KAH0968127.1 hypothetical protein HRG_00769 [Hirsutella rhossiliensis]